MKDSGGGNFIVAIKDVNGDYIDQAANELGSYHGSKMVKLYPGTFYAQVTIIGIEGSWSIDIIKA
jgi:hypothetical protein